MCTNYWVKYWGCLSDRFLWIRAMPTHSLSAEEERMGIWGLETKPMKTGLEACYLSEVSFWVLLFEMLITLFHFRWLFDLSGPRNSPDEGASFGVFAEVLLSQHLSVLRLTPFVFPGQMGTVNNTVIGKPKHKLLLSASECHFSSASLVVYI